MTKARVLNALYKKVTVLSLTMNKGRLGPKKKAWNRANIEVA